MSSLGWKGLISACIDSSKPVFSKQANIKYACDDNFFLTQFVDPFRIATDSIFCKLVILWNRDSQIQ